VKGKGKKEKRLAMKLTDDHFEEMNDEVIDYRHDEDYDHDVVMNRDEQVIDHDEDYEHVLATLYSTYHQPHQANQFISLNRHRTKFLYVR
jgi:ABC-type Zn2+ transport system substrate-binding protein/surface adhesin